MKLNERWRNLVERPRLVKLLVIFYGLQGFLLLSIFIYFFFFVMHARMPS